jgi:hypothetical protein
LRVNALANPEVGKYINEHFCSSFQRVATFRIVGGQKQGGNVAAYFCAPDGRVLHCVAGPVNAATLLKETKWVVETATRCVKECKGDGAIFKSLLRTAHADKLRKEHGLVVEPVTFDNYEEQDPNSPLQYKDPTGKPLAPKLPAPPIEGPDVKLLHLQEALKKEAAGAGADANFAVVKDKKGKGGWVLNNQGRVHLLLAAHGMAKIETVYGSVFEGILGERITTQPVEVVDPFPGRDKLKKK